MSNAITYPNDRPDFFANDFIRLMADACLANEIGADACYLLTLVVMTEDRIRYAREVTFYNSQLTRLMGYKDDDAMAHVRAKPVRLGWLAYTPGCKGTPGRYFVTVPPEYQQVIPTAERRSKVRRNGGESPEELREKSGGSPEEVPTFHTHPCPVPASPIPPAPPELGEGGTKSKKKTRTKTAAESAAEADPRFVRFWSVWPKKVDKPDAAEEFARINPSPELLEQIIAAVERQKRSEDWTKENGRFRTHPKKWLRNRKWEDSTELPASQPSRPATKTTSYADLDQDIYGPPVGGGR